MGMPPQDTSREIHTEVNDCWQHSPGRRWAWRRLVRPSLPSVRLLSASPPIRAARRPGRRQAPPTAGGPRCTRCAPGSSTWKAVQSQPDQVAHQQRLCGELLSRTMDDPELAEVLDAYEGAVSPRKRRQGRPLTGAMRDACSASSSRPSATLRGAAHQAPHEPGTDLQAGTGTGASGPTYRATGLMIFVSSACSRMLALQPTARAAAKVGVNISRGRPQSSMTTPA